MQIRPGHLIIPAAIAAAIVVPLASRGEDPAAGQIVPPGSPVTTPQPTVPCTPVDGCGHNPGDQSDVAFAWIDRYCNGDAIPTPPGFTTFAVNYGIGGAVPGPVQFTGVATVNGVEFPTNPLDLLNPGERDVRLRAVEIPSGAVVEFLITGVLVDTGQPIVFGNGTTTRVRSAAGPCPDAPPAIVPTTPIVGTTPTPDVPSGTIPPAE